MQECFRFAFLDETNEKHLDFMHSTNLNSLVYIMEVMFLLLKEVVMDALATHAPSQDGSPMLGPLFTDGLK